MEPVQITTNGSSGLLQNPKKERSTGSRSSRKKPQSPFKSIKNTFLLRGTKSKRAEPEVQKITDASTPKIRKEIPKGVVRGTEKDRKNQRLSAQRVTLFKYDHVKVMNFAMPKQRSSSESSTSTLNSQSSVVRRVNTQEEVINKNSKRSTCLISDGPLEIYQIITQNINAPPQKMTYLCLGRKGNIIHPILPKLQITKLDCTQLKFLVLLYNPERYWEIEFLHPNEGVESLWQTNEDFEAVIKTICQYSNDGGNEDISDEGEQKDETDLEYLLDDCITHSDEESTLDDASVKPSQEELISVAFKRALKNITMHEDKETDVPLIKRYSSCYGISSPALSQKQNRRSISAPFEFSPRVAMSRQKRSVNVQWGLDGY